MSQERQLPLQSAQDRDYTQFVSKIKIRTGIDLSCYKESQMRRRLTSMKDNRGYRTFGDFYQAIQQDNKLYEQLLEHMTINVSEFYRNVKRWEVLERAIMPELLARSRSIRCWSAACSTGDEPYTLVMMLAKKFKMSDIHILATDIDQAAIRKAKEGVYPAQSVKEVPRPLLGRYFKMQGSFFAIADEIKRCVTFKRHNLLADAYETNFDLIVCRNVLIYFTDEAKDAIIQKFSRSLKQGGYLFVGGTEQIFNAARYRLEPADTFFYRKI